MNKLAEDREKILELVRRKVQTMDQELLRMAVLNYGGSKARNFFGQLLGVENLIHDN